MAVGGGADGEHVLCGEAAAGGGERGLGLGAEALGERGAELRVVELEQQLALVVGVLAELVLLDDAREGEDARGAEGLGRGGGAREGNAPLRRKGRGRMRSHTVRDREG